MKVRRNACSVHWNQQAVTGVKNKRTFRWLMKVFVLAVFSLLSAGSACAQVDQPSAAKQELNLGVQAYRAANYEEAIQHFERAAKLDPTMNLAHLYLATAYAQQYVPGVETPENVANAKKAIEEYDQTLRFDPGNVVAVKGTAYLNFQMKKFDEARASYKRAIELDPSDAENFYSLGVIDWSMAYRDMAEVTEKLNRSPISDADDDDDESDDDSAMETPKSNNDPEYTVIFSPLCANLRTEQLPRIEDGMAMLNRAVELRKEYDDALVYLNLVFRLRADLQCGDRAAHDADITKANELTDRAMAFRKKKVADDAKQQAPANSPPQ